MSLPPATQAELAAQWRAWRRLYPIYAALVQEFAPTMPPCRPLESPIDRMQPEIVATIHEWFARADEYVHSYQLRQLLQTTNLATSENLAALLRHHLAKDTETEADRDKVDFLLVQYFAHHAHAEWFEREVSPEEVAEIMHPVLGEVTSAPPVWLAPLDDLLRRINACGTLSEIREQRLLEEGRELKIRAGENFFQPAALLGLTRFNFHVRQAFFRILQSDLEAVRLGLDELAARDVKTVDCTRAQLSACEPVHRLRQLCRHWQTSGRTAYSAGQSFRQLIGIRAAVEDALADTASLPVIGTPVEAPLPFVPAAAEKPQPTAYWEEPKAVDAKPVPAALLQEGAVEPSPDVQACMEQIAEQIHPRAADDEVLPATIMLGDTRLLLSSWEVAAFRDGDDELARALQRAVATRALLYEAMEMRRRTGQWTELFVAIPLAHLEAAFLQECVAQGRDRRNLDAAANLAASAKRLLTLVEAAERARPQPRYSMEMFS